MKKLTAIGILLLLCSVTFVAYASSAVKIFVNDKEIQPDVLPQIINDRVMVPIRFIAEELGADVQWDEHTNSVYIKNEPKIISSLLEADAKLYPFQETDGSYKGFILEIKGERKYFDWENTVNPTYAPKMLYDDINNDGKNELIIILTVATGTGVHIEEPHIITTDTFTEFIVESPQQIIIDNIKSEITDNKDYVNIQITVGDENFSIIKEKAESVNWFSDVVFDNSRYYEIIDGHLTMSMGAQASPGMFIGEIKIIYAFDFKENIFEHETIEFTEY